MNHIQDPTWNLLEDSIISELYQQAIQGCRSRYGKQSVPQKVNIRSPLKKLKLSPGVDQLNSSPLHKELDLEDILFRKEEEMPVREIQNGLADLNAKIVKEKREEVQKKQRDFSKLKIFSPLLLSDLISLEEGQVQQLIDLKTGGSIDDQASTEEETHRSTISLENLDKRGRPSSSSSLFDDLKTEIVNGNISWKDLVLTQEHLRIIMDRKLLEEL